ncbi:MAG: hypothetical protein J0I12_11205 [Candidatus Eremiobacteraeota bacterium]|nr:hypothetical protein [Candidatus Eremiobacteraeota bacterium]
MNPKTNDAKAKSIGEYLSRLLCGVLVEQEGFCGKRPFGNSGWTRELHMALVKADVIKGVIDSDGYLDSYDDEAADKLILEAAQQAFGTNFQFTGGR